VFPHVGLFSEVAEALYFRNSKGLAQVLRMAKRKPADVDHNWFRRISRLEIRLGSRPLLKRCFDLKFTDHFFQEFVCFVTKCFRVLDLFSQHIELRFLFVQLPRIALQQRLFLRASA